jgi:hypothetical protein
MITSPSIRIYSLKKILVPLKKVFPSVCTQSGSQKKAWNGILFWVTHSTFHKKMSFIDIPSMCHVADL